MGETLTAMTGAAVQRILQLMLHERWSHEGSCASDDDSAWGAQAATLALQEGCLRLLNMHTTGSSGRACPVQGTGTREPTPPPPPPPPLQPSTPPDSLLEVSPYLAAQDGHLLVGLCCDEAVPQACRDAPSSTHPDMQRIFHPTLQAWAAVVRILCALPCTNLYACTA